MFWAPISCMKFNSVLKTWQLCNFTTTKRKTFSRVRPDSILNLFSAVCFAAQHQASHCAIYFYYYWTREFPARTPTAKLPRLTTTERRFNGLSVETLSFNVPSEVLQEVLLFHQQRKGNLSGLSFNIKLQPLIPLYVDIPHWTSQIFIQAIRNCRCSATHLR